MHIISEPCATILYFAKCEPSKFNGMILCNSRVLRTSEINDINIYPRIIENGMQYFLPTNGNIKGRNSSLVHPDFMD